MTKEKWIIAIANTEADGVEMIYILGNINQVKEFIMSFVYEDRGEDEDNFVSGTDETSEIEKVIKPTTGETVRLDAYNAFINYHIDYTAQKLDAMQYCEL